MILILKWVQYNNLLNHLNHLNQCKFLLDWASNNQGTF